MTFQNGGPGRLVKNCKQHRAVCTVMLVKEPKVTRATPQAAAHQCSCGTGPMNWQRLGCGQLWDPRWPHWRSAEYSPGAEQFPCRLCRCSFHRSFFKQSRRWKKNVHKARQPALASCDEGVLPVLMAERIRRRCGSKY